MVLNRSLNSHQTFKKINWLLKFFMTLEHKSCWIWPMLWVILRETMVYGLYTHICDKTTRKSHMKTSNEIPSYDLDCQLRSSLREITMPSNLSCGTSNMSLAMWHVAPSFWNHLSMVYKPSNTEQKKFIIITN